MTALAARPTARVRRHARPGLLALLVLAVVYGALVLLAATPGSRLVPATAGGSPDWLLGPLRPLGLSAGSRSPAGPLFYAGLWLALLAYAVVIARAHEIPRAAAVTALAGLHLLFALAPPLLSQDAFSYLAYARLGAVHGLDPYLAAPASVPADAVFAFAGSKEASSVYGPPFTLATYALAEVSVPVGLWVLKATAAAASLGAVVLVWRAAARRGLDPRAAALVVGLNPALLVHVVGGAHNEALILLLTASALRAHARGREARGATLATAAAAVKASAALLVPFLIAGARRHRRAGAALAAVAVALGALLIGLGGFGAEAVGWLDAVRENQARTSSFSLPYKTAELLGALLPGERLDFRGPVRLVYAAAFAAVAGWLLVRTWRGADPVAMAGWATLALLVCSAWLVPWYVAWLVPLAALGRSRPLVTATLALTAWTLAIAIPW
ncbi:MAG: hypothetical protein AVDCRST_MAG45-801 [uncultured Solirubrobacterales bacterium]|uniref:DUF2029 domain-containing protein n=1 Tax=uncultured Solirubrobacterales bacterium TaxID=768556 RepID=A0A6J4S8B5_9ACTN|nr:MAG: hypothetical protein AVDCRST_MAG45-801 [uncultured Solirubrobacterales bacterium]